MDQLPFIDESNISQIIKTIDFNKTDDISNTLKSFIDHAPFMANILSLFIDECIKKNSIFTGIFQHILESKSDIPEVDLSRCIYAAYLGANTNLKNIPRVSTVYMSMTLECNVLDNYNGELKFFYCAAILKELSFSQYECTERLSKLPSEVVMELIIKDQSPFNLSILIRMCKYLDFLEILKHRINEFNKKDEIIACVFVNYTIDDDRRDENSSGSESIETRKDIMRSLIQGSSLDYCLKVVNKEHLSNLMKTKYETVSLKKISYEFFQEMVFESKKEFFEAFLLLTSPSVSHFLSYLEILKKDFILSDQEQQDFVYMLKDFHSKNQGYLDIVLSKLLQYKIVKTENFN